MTLEESEAVDGSGMRIGVVAARWNGLVTEKLLAGAVDRLRELGVAEVWVIRVPGALELPVGARGLIDKGCDAVVAIGAVVRGETDHYEVVVRESAAGIARVATETGIPVTNAILAVSDFAQARERAGEGRSNRGAEAAEAAVATAVAISSAHPVRNGS